MNNHMPQCLAHFEDPGCGPVRSCVLDVKERSLDATWVIRQVQEADLVQRHGLDEAVQVIKEDGVAVEVQEVVTKPVHTNVDATDWTPRWVISCHGEGKGIWSVSLHCIEI